MPIKIKQPAATPQDFYIAGISASAGGPDAFKQFLQAVPKDSGMAYVLLQPQQPDHDSLLALSGVTMLPVAELTDTIHIVPNTVYVIPQNKALIMIDGMLKLVMCNDKAVNYSTDTFFTSLAEACLNRAVGVVLSGNGQDGVQGLKAIKQHGGITFAEGTALYASIADYVLPANEIPAMLQSLADTKKALAEKHRVHDEGIFSEILQLLRQHSGVDFTYYKQTTIRRRIARRMAMSKSLTLTDYLKLLREDKLAPEALFNDLLIPVTEFFRDPKIFQSLKDTVFPVLVKTESEANSIRIWIAGCSTGEEAYSLAILLHEFLGENLTGKQIQIFASDISELAIAKARIGFYTKTQLGNVSENLLKKYFTKNNTNGYQINRQIRDLCVFAVHNFLKDPPFARMNLISCRNVLIYMDPLIQKKSLTTFHYALKQGGFLLLGKSETTGPADELFLSVEKSGKIYTRRQVLGKTVHAAMKNKQTPYGKNQPKVIAEVQKNDFKKSAEQALLSKYTPASVVVNEQMDIVHIHGSIAPFLEFSPGKPTFNLLKIARDGLAFELRNAWHKVKETMATVVKQGIVVKDLEGNSLEISIEVQPLTDTLEPYFLVVFYKTLSQKDAFAGNGLTAEQLYNDGNLRRISQLEKELGQIQYDVNAIAEGQESSNEELQSANEELLSGSEELQSLNEELETSKEELQSSNEELVQINQELLNKQQQINTSRNYTEAIVATLREPIVVLDTKLRIKNINRAFSKKYKIEKQEAEGKLIYEIQNHLFDNVHMRAMLEKVLPQKTQLDDYQVTVNLLPYGESIMLLNARQVTNETSKEQLILLAIEDITERRIIEKRLQVLSDGFETKVAERTADLLTANTDLENSVKDLHDANIRLQDFAYVASHDLQEPLRKILMFTSKLLNKTEGLPDSALEVLNKISKSSDRMKALIQDLLAYSYLNNDEKQFVDTDLNSVLENILTDFELLIEEQNVEIKLGPMPVINAIPLQMNQLFYNLISNALKFHKTDGTRLVISIKSQRLTAKQVMAHTGLDKDLQYFEIIIKDNGIGFDQLYENKIYTIFQRLHNNEVYTGTGIGLAIGKKIIDNHRGIIFSRAKENKGAAFHIILPVL